MTHCLQECHPDLYLHLQRQGIRSVDMPLHLSVPPFAVLGITLGAVRDRQVLYH